MEKTPPIVMRDIFYKRSKIWYVLLEVTQHHWCNIQCASVQYFYSTRTDAHGLITGQVSTKHKCQYWLIKTATDS